jgi:cytochrome c556
MKKILTAIALTSLLTGPLMAGEMDHRTMLMKDMRTMLEGMEQIQRGGFYSSKDDMNAGVKKLQGTLKTLESDEIKWILPKDQVYAYQFAQKSARMLRLYSDDLVTSIDAGHMDEAMEDYNQLVKQCASCHIRIRNW